MKRAQAIMRARAVEAEIQRHKNCIASLEEELLELRKAFAGRRPNSLITRMLEVIEQRPGICSEELAKAVGTTLANTQCLMSRFGTARGLAERRHFGGWRYGWFPARRSA